MDEMKFGDEIEETSSKNEKPRSNVLPIIIIVVIALIVGFGVFFIPNSLIGGKKEEKVEEPKETPLLLTEENVEILYDYVTYGVNNKRNDKFLKEPKVTLDSFSNQEKFYYALQFAQPEDFIFTEKLTEDKKKIYNISDNTIKNYMQRFFGGKVTYNNSVTLTYPFSFSINGQNVGIMTPNATTGGLDTIFDGVEKPKEETDVVQPYYYALTAAYKEPDGTYKLEEKVIYTRVEEKEGTYIIYLYKDYAQTSLIETKLNQTKETLQTTPIDIKNYKDKASTVTYHFGLYNNMLYFESSEIS